jgi:hypothetical protein
MLDAGDKKSVLREDCGCELVFRVLNSVAVTNDGNWRPQADPALDICQRCIGYRNRNDAIATPIDPFEVIMTEARQLAKSGNQPGKESERARAGYEETARHG